MRLFFILATTFLSVTFVQVARWSWCHLQSLLYFFNTFTVPSSSLCPSLDLYHAWVAPALQSDLLVQFWVRSTGVLPSDCSLGWKVLDVTRINPGKTFEFKTSQDHSKWAVSTKAAGAGAGGGWVCVGDINRNVAEEQRGGGTVCLRDPVVWKAYRTAVLDYEDCRGGKM